MGWAVKAVGLVIMAAPFGAHAQFPICDVILTHESYEAAVFEINYGEGGPDVIVIRNGELEPESGYGRGEQPHERPEMDIPMPQLEIIVPTPSRREREDQVPLPIIHPDINPNITPDKKPEDDLPN